MPSPLCLVYTATTTDGHHRLPSPIDYAAADWCFYLHNCAPSLPVCFCCRRLMFSSSRLCNFVIMVERLHLHYLRHRQTLLPLLRKFCYFTNHDVYKSFDISACNAVLFYYNKWFSNFQDFYSDFTQEIATRRQEATILDSMFSCFPTNQRVGATQIQGSKFDKLYVKMKQSIHESANEFYGIYFGSHKFSFHFRASALLQT